MPRKVRELEDGGIYHIYNRGNNRRILYRAEKDFAVFRRLWLRAKERYDFWVYHYCWMSNHYHILLKIGRGKELGSLLHWVQLGYARYFKKRYKISGRFFQERYRSPKIPEESYYLQCGRYIERNPVVAGITKEAVDYRYSSAAFYGLGQQDDLITENLYYAGMGKTAEERRKYYREFLSLEDPYRSMVDGALIKV